MKFTQSERILHNFKFTPPCNYYDIDKRNDTKVLHGSLAGPVLPNQNKNTFGNDKRFAEQKYKQTPGPGEYFDQKKQLFYDFKKDLKNPKKFLKNTFRYIENNPSIPYKILSEQKLDEEDKVFIKQLYLMQNPSKAVENIRKKQPSYSFAKSPRKIIPENEEKQKSLQKIPDQLSKPSSALQKIQQKEYYGTIKEKINNQQSQKKKPLVDINQTIRKASKKRNEIINNIGADFIPSLELVGLMSKMRTKYVPGPGFYDPKNNDSFSKAVDNISESNIKGAIFSSVKRFNLDKKDILGPGSYNVNNESFSKKGGLIGKEKRKILDVKQKKDIQFRFYINPDPEPKTNSELNIQRSNSCTTFRKKTIVQGTEPLSAFGSSSKRFSVVSSVSKDEEKSSQISEYELKKKNAFKIQLKTKIKKMYSEDRRSTKQDSGLLGISTMANLLE